jgi:hypothetical protein
VGIFRKNLRAMRIAQTLPCIYFLSENICSFPQRDLLDRRRGAAPRPLRKGVGAGTPGALEVGTASTRLYFILPFEGRTTSKRKITLRGLMRTFWVMFQGYEYTARAREILFCNLCPPHQILKIP